ncbi:hypothetical protein HZS_6288 [Henneguya salminicola]|nr:hypothetical protein HZS_6288 [Henneguya salminicola]
MLRSKLARQDTKNASSSCLNIACILCVMTGRGETFYWISLKKAVKVEFSSPRVLGCFFPFTQAILKIKEEISNI